MTYAINLSPRQSARTLEQAIRHRAVVQLRPRVRPNDAPILCRLEAFAGITAPALHRGCLVLSTAGPEHTGNPAPPLNPHGSWAPEISAATFGDLLGAYCDATLDLGQCRYLFCSHVVTIQATHRGGFQIHLAPPEILQVAQRRRFARFAPQRSSQIELRWMQQDGTTVSDVGWLCNLGAGGLACRTEVRVGDQLGIGDQLRVQFKLAVEDAELYALDAVLCNKTPAGTQGKVILGVQYLTGPGHESSARAAEGLRRQLLTRFAPVTRTS